MKRIFFIPGAGETSKLEHSKDFLNLANKKGYEVVPLIRSYGEKYLFKKGSFKDLCSSVEKEIKNKKVNKQDVIVGFSIGGLVAYHLSSKIKFYKSLVCSMTVILGKDLLKYPPEEVKKLFHDFQIKELNKTPYKKALSSMVLLCGQLERIEMKQRFRELSKEFGYKLVFIKGNNHDFSGKYIEVLSKFL